MFDSKTYELSLSREYVAHWGMVEAVRELIQNAIDSDSPFVYEFREEDDKTATLTLRSEFTVLTPQTLLLGTTSKRDNGDMIGSFGEGYKIALLVLTRGGYQVQMFNGDVEWTPKFRMNKKFGVEQLVIDERPTSDRTNKGLAFVVGGLDDREVSEIIESCLMMQNQIGEIKQTTRGDILMERPGKLYVGGLYICKTELQYGYNIKPQYLKLERDRQTVDNWDMLDVTLQMWYETKEFDRIAKMIDQEVPDVRNARFGAPEIVKEACYDLFRQRNPGAVVAESQQQLKQLVAQGMERVVIVNSTMYSAVSTSRSYRNEPVVKLISPAERLEAFLATHKFHMHADVIGAFKKLIDESKEWRLK